MKLRFARLQIVGAKTSAHVFKSDVGMKSRGDDFDGIELSIVKTSSTVPGGSSSKRAHRKPKNLQHCQLVDVILKS